MSLRDVIRKGKRMTYRVYKLKPGDGGKGLRQIAREQLKNESLFEDIIRQLDAPNPATGLDWEEIANKNSVDVKWTLLLPVVQSQPVPPPVEQRGTFHIKGETNVYTAPRVEAGKLFFKGPKGTQYTYLVKSKFTDRQTGMTWVDVTPSNLPGKTPGAKYWMCVREGNVTRTDPPL